MTSITRPSEDTDVPHSTLTTVDRGYGRARLRLGITGVGLWVVISVLLLTTDAAATARQQLPDGLGAEVSLLAVTIAAYVLIQLPFDWLGGWIVPRRFDRESRTASAYAKVLARGVVVHTAILSGSAIVMYTGGSIAGTGGALVATLVWILALAAARCLLARIVARYTPTTHVDDDLRDEFLHCPDAGFTGSVTGVFSPRKNILPSRWREELSSEQFGLVKARRAHIMRSGAWRAGRTGAYLFTAGGLAVSLWLAGPDAAGTAVGVIEASLWFTLWSFLGLLCLPTLSRKAIHAIDQRLIADGHDRETLDRLSHALDRMQDGEPVRSPWIERIFHPIPNASNRASTHAATRAALWDIARTSIFLSLGGMSLLTRSVHCNVGRPALWIWLPTE
jgi:hypothetical protein